MPAKANTNVRVVMSGRLNQFGDEYHDYGDNNSSAK